MNNVDPDPRVYYGCYDQQDRARLFYGNSQRMEPVRHVVKHSPAGLAWGYAGAGPADTSLSLLTHAVARVNPDRVGMADNLHQDYKRLRIAELTIGEPFEIPAVEIEEYLARHGVHAEPERARGQGPTLPQTNLYSAIRSGLDATPVRDQLIMTRIRTQDPWPTIAAGMQLPLGLVEDLIDRRRSVIQPTEIRAVCEALRCTPLQLWRRDEIASCEQAYPRIEWLVDTEPLEQTITGWQPSNPSPITDLDPELDIRLGGH